MRLHRHRWIDDGSEPKSGVLLLHRHCATCEKHQSRFFYGYSTAPVSAYGRWHTFKPSAASYCGPMTSFKPGTKRYLRHNGIKAK